MNMKIYHSHFMKVLSKFKKRILCCLLDIFPLLRKLKNHNYVFFIVDLRFCDDITKRYAKSVSKIGWEIKDISGLKTYLC